MDKQFESLYHTLEDKNWWFLARQDFILKYLKKSKLPLNARILDIGCGSGGLIAHLQQHGYRNIHGVDISSEAVKGCQQRGLTNITLTDAGSPLPFPQNYFSFIVASDVLEHLNNPVQSLTQWAETLSADGRILLFVPAFNFLWSTHDDINHHKMRYTKKLLHEHLTKAGLQPIITSYWNFFLFFPYAILTTLKKVIGYHKDFAPTQNNLLNGIFTELLMIENKIILSGVRLPFGVSCMSIAQRTK